MKLKLKYQNQEVDAHLSEFCGILDSAEYAGTGIQLDELELLELELEYIDLINEVLYE